MPDNPTTIFRARRIITMTGQSPEAFAVTGEHIAVAGSAGELRGRFADADVVDFGNAVVVPGFHDAHLHLGSAADNFLRLDVSPPEVTSLAQLKQRIRQETARVSAGTWIRTGRYDDGKMAEGRVLTRWDLDEVAPNHPVLVPHIAMHWGVMNSAALQLAGIGEDSTPPQGGAYGRDASGRLNGVLNERAYSELVRADSPRRAVPMDTLEDRLAGLRRAVERMHAAGLTSVCDARVTPEHVQLFREGLRRGILTLRLNMLAGWESYDTIRRTMGEPEGAGGQLRVIGVKGVLDGAIGGRTCLMEQPFEGTSDDFGIQSMSTADLRDMVRQVREHGGRPCVHANGDRAISMLLDELEAAPEASGPLPPPRIEHCTIVNDDILQRVKRLGAIPTPFATYVNYHGANLLKWYGAERVQRMFAHRTFLDWGIPAAGASDYPCGPFEPLLALQSCTTRRGWDGATVGENQRISPYEALALYTTGAAYATGEDQVKGQLAPGFLADFVVLGEDPLAADPHQLSTIPVRETYVGGRQVWKAA